MPNRRKTIVYIDGYNLYHGAVKDTQHKWLDLFKFSQALIPQEDIIKVKYFTAPAMGYSDIKSPIRQKVFWDAHNALYGDKFELIKGHFQKTSKRFPLAHNQNFSQSKRVKEPLEHAWVIKTEEKGTDVNIAVHLVNDAWKNEYDVALLISNDNDLERAVKIVTEERNKIVLVVNPACAGNRPNHAKKLNNVSTTSVYFQSSIFADCLLPESIPETTIVKPSEW